MKCDSCLLERSPEQLSPCPFCGALVCGIHACTAGCICDFGQDAMEDLARDLGLEDFDC